MGRRSQKQQLHVWMNGIPVGVWQRTPQEESLRYFEKWVADEQGRPLSLSLPFTPGNQVYKGQLVSAFFDNLLPDSDAIRRRLAQRYQVAGVAPFDLLAALGRDCVGALQLLPEDEQPNSLYSLKGQPLTSAQVAQQLRDSTAGGALGQHGHDADLRLSIAGAQEKTALLLHAGQWMRPQGSTPTTHIFKLPLGLVGNMQADMRTSVENEWLCSRLVAAYGLAVAHCDIAHFEEQKVLIVQRFDRKPASDDSWIVRLPQEDFCQATGTWPLAKYQADGGPGIAAIMEVLRGSEQAEQDRRNFFKAQLVFWLLAATDGHAKNFSIAHLPGGRYCSTPLYDILSAHPILGSGRNRIAPQKAKLAMAVRGNSHNIYLLGQIQRRHWAAQARQVGLGAGSAEEVIAELIAATEAVLTDVAAKLPADFPEDLSDAILGGVRSQCAKLAAMPA
ncbi:type II toxin-antitoxin system HipA family toxin [Collimonas sp.]|jgi:serine/threonine-protein kinase HipA|uniref:type II toxin-antitoxin system HipA family toxin n=1 Tax=Collimonas sp. TaxID=1963772 RepID=UPI002BC2E1F9|nr:type II toxin-antitoxin system HipA family toxin [Collimonas sp.]HWW05774.1 type II toxin-antitoxin system HipA family toxin [Collimonas sp.]